MIFDLHPEAGFARLAKFALAIPAHRRDQSLIVARQIEDESGLVQDALVRARTPPRAAPDGPLVAPRIVEIVQHEVGARVEELQTPDHLVDLRRLDTLRQNQAAPHRAAPLHDGFEFRLVDKPDPAEIFLERCARLECDRTIFPRRISGRPGEGLA